MRVTPDPVLYEQDFTVTQDRSMTQCIFDRQFSKDDQMNRKIFFLTLAVFLTVFGAPSCKHKQEKVQEPPEIPVVKVVEKDVPVYKEFVGQIYGKLDIPIRARVSGFLEGIYFREGLRVKKGQLLYVIDPQPFEAQVAEQMSRVAEAKTQLVKAKSDLDRIKPLAAINAVSQSDLDAALARYEAARSQVDAAKASLDLKKIQLSYTRIKSPIDGLIGKSLAKVGEFVGESPNPVILNTVSQIDTMYVEFFLPETDYLELARSYETRRKHEQEKIKALDRLQLILSDGSVFKHRGKIRFVNRNVDPSSGSILIQSAFPNPEKLLRPGQFARIKMEMDILNNAMVVPLRSILELQGKFYLYTVDADGIVQQKEVQAGPLLGDLQVVTEGVHPGEQIVLEGIQMVRSGMKVKPVLKEFHSQSREK